MASFREKKLKIKNLKKKKNNIPSLQKSFFGDTQPKFGDSISWISKKKQIR